MKLELALAYLPKVIENDIRHIDYERVCILAKDYFAYYTGKGLDEKLQQVTSTETKEEFDQRKLLTKHITKSVLNSTKIPFNKALRKKPEHNKIDFITKGKENAIKEINEYIETFNGTRSLDEFLEVLFIEFNYHDPNAWLIVEFESNDVRRKAQPYPFIATADQVIDYKLNNGILDYVIVMLDIKYTEEGKQKDGKKYTLYAGNETIVIKNIGSDYTLEQGQESIEINDKRYSKEVFTVKAKTDPDLTPAAIRFGYIQDPATQYRTFLSVYDCAMPYIEKTLKINSEFDQSNAMITFAQRYAYQNRCNAEGCYKGKMTHDGSDCPVCKGTGVTQAHTGVQQIMYLPLPDNKEEMIDLNGLMVYKTPPIELLTFQKDYINQLKIDIHTTIFNVDLISKTEVSTTATEQLLNRDNMNDTLLPFARHYSEVRTLCVYFIAVYTDNVKSVSANGKTQPDIIISHKFPYDFKLKTLNELMGDLKAAYDSKASIATISAIEDDINEILYYDRPDELKKIRTINKYNPFRGNTPDEVKLMIASNLVNKFDQVLYTNLFNIFAELERENQEPWFYDLDEKKIYDLVVKKVEERAGKLTNEQPKPIERVDYNSPVPQTNEEYIVYDDQIQINFKTNNKFISSDDDLLITPVVLMTEGVHNGSHGAILHKISELGKIPASWNGIPIVINHPKKEDKYVSANNPQILKESEVGRIYNTRVENDKLVSEAWINKAKLKAIHSNLLNDLQEGNEIEVSIGAFPEYKLSKGDWSGEKYDAIAINYRPDHLAILPDTVGACSNEDGAGINVNGGEGSGNFGHAGRPGLVGGSGAGDMGEKLTNKDWDKLYNTEHKYSRDMENKLDNYEDRILKDYTNSLFGDVNRDLRNEKYSEELYLIERGLNNSLDRFPDFKGTVYRSMRLNESESLDFINKLKNDKEVEFLGFTSTNKNGISGRFLGENGKIVLEIKSKRGKDISFFTKNENEAEVLFKSKSKFRYISHEKIMESKAYDWQPDILSFYKVKIEEV